jgi:hypothetical protein
LKKERAKVEELLDNSDLENCTVVLESEVSIKILENV